jgi:CMP-N-acetylneuraminic acid synthetase
MVTAIFPVYVSSNPFWSSPRGLSCVDEFLRMVGRVKEIGRGIVATKDPEIFRIAEQNGFEVERNFVPERINGPRSFDQFISLAKRFNGICSNPSDAILMIDHRNLLLTANDISQACRTHAQAPGLGVVSLTFCKDYPCQYKAYSIFLGAGTFHFAPPDTKDEESGSRLADPRHMTWRRGDYGEVTLAVNPEGAACRISFSSREPAPERIVARIIPFDCHGPKYKLSRELLLFPPFFKTFVDIDINAFPGMIVLLSVPSMSGEYDTVELFTPPNAPWELSPSESVVRDMKTCESMCGRQQFPSTYVFDGSFCILGRNHLFETETSLPMPVILSDSCIVSDWVDYWYTATAS